MTYCLAIQLNAGLVFASDSRTNAGVDQISTYPKMHVFNREGEYLLVLLSSGNLATTQAVVKRLEMDACADDDRPSLRTLRHMSEVARYLGRISMEVQHYHRELLGDSSVNFEATFILGGQLAGQAHEMYLIYPQGNYIAASPNSPFFQIGETKYGKPILDRVIDSSVPLEAAARCALVSMDSTVRSNLTVGPPFDLAIYEKDALKIARKLHYKQNSPYFASLRKAWGEGLHDLFLSLPRFDWEAADGKPSIRGPGDADE